MVPREHETLPEFIAEQAADAMPLMLAVADAP